MEDALPCQVCTTHSADEEHCAICFEDRPSMTLPCACKTTYCASCWNRAMASSVQVRGKAQCPSCRMVLRIDLDPDTGDILFSKQDGETSHDMWQPRLSKKAKLVQIKYLKSYGSKVKQECISANKRANAPCNNATAKSLDQPAIDLMNGFTLQNLGKPACFCGASLKHVTYKERFLGLREDFEAEWRHRTSYAIACNLCDTVVPQNSSLWTCEDGCRSVLHLSSNDICESCYSKHVGLVSRCKASQSRCAAPCMSIIGFKFPW